MTDSKPDLISRIKRKLRQNPFLSYLIGCPYPAPRWNRCVKKRLQRLGPDARILDLGAGNRRRAPNVINLEIEVTPEVDIVADGHFLPFSDRTFDAVVSEAVLEHVQSPNLVVEEIYRVLKPGGYICLAVPFLQGYHASPHDYQRWTVPGVVQLCAAFSELESGPLCRSNDLFALDLPRIYRAGLFVRQSTPRENNLSYCRVADISNPTLRYTTLLT